MSLRIEIPLPPPAKSGTLSGHVKASGWPPKRPPHGPRPEGAFRGGGARGSRGPSGNRGPASPAKPARQARLVARGSWLRPAPWAVRRDSPSLPARERRSGRAPGPAGFEGLEAAAPRGPSGRSLWSGQSPRRAGRSAKAGCRELRFASAPPECRNAARASGGLAPIVHRTGRGSSSRDRRPRPAGFGSLQTRRLGGAATKKAPPPSRVGVGSGSTRRRGVSFFPGTAQRTLFSAPAPRSLSRSRTQEQPNFVVAVQFPQDIGARPICGIAAYSPLFESRAIA